MSELRLPPNAGHLRGNEVVATILDLVTPAAQCAQVLTPIVGRNVVDVVPVEALALAAPLAGVRLGVEPVRLAASTARSVRLLGRSRAIGHAKVGGAHCVTDMLRPGGAVDGVPLAFRPARNAVGRVPRDRRSTVRAHARPLALLAPRLDALRPITAPRVRAQRLVLSALAARLGVHASSLRECHTSDPKQLAKAARRPFVPPAEQTEGQLDLLEGIA